MMDPIILGPYWAHKIFRNCLIFRNSRKPLCYPLIRSFGHGSCHGINIDRSRPADQTCGFPAGSKHSQTRPDGSGPASLEGASGGELRRLVYGSAI